MTDVAVMPSRMGRNVILGQGASDRIDNAAQVVSDILDKSVDDGVNLLSVLEYMRNQQAKIAFVLPPYKQVLSEVLRAPEKYTKEQVSSLQEYVRFLSDMFAGVGKFFSEIISITKSGWIETLLMVERVYNTSPAFIMDALLKQIPARGVRLVIERWTGPAPSLSDEQQFEVVEFPATVKEVRTEYVSMGARTSLYEDAKERDENKVQLDEAFQKAGLGAAPVAVGVIVRFLTWIFGKKMGEYMVKHGIMLLIRGGSALFSIKGATIVVSLVLIYKLGSSVAREVVPGLASVIRNLVDGADRAAVAIKGAIGTLTVIAAIAAGVVLIGGAIALVTSR